MRNQFGERLFGIFFKTYTEKVWGMRCDEISADWAAQRIKGLSASAPRSSTRWRPFGSRRHGVDRRRCVKTLIEASAIRAAAPA